MYEALDVPNVLYAFFFLPVGQDNYYCSVFAVHCLGFAVQR